MVDRKPQLEYIQPVASMGIPSLYESPLGVCSPLVDVGFVWAHCWFIEAGSSSPSGEDGLTDMYYGLLKIYVALSVIRMIS